MARPSPSCATTTATSCRLAASTSTTSRPATSTSARLRSTAAHPKFSATCSRRRCWGYSALLDHLIGLGQQRTRDGEAECPGRLQLDVHLEAARFLNRQAGRRRTPQYLVDIYRLALELHKARGERFGRGADRNGLQAERLAGLFERRRDDLGVGLVGVDEAREVSH